MIDFAAYTPAMLQATAALVRDAIHSGLEIKALLAVLEKQTVAIVPSAPPVRPRQPAAPASVCPGCGHRLVAVANSEGLAIVGCKSCRYSRIDGGIDG